ncbi:MAG TPA: nitroreductase family protein [Dehalococcoidales bacterium]|nr:nitroreductase family protein [Dehalococcoidales bacterium]
MLKDLILKNRSYRRFYQDAISESTLKELVDLARNSASASNRQPLKYILSYDPAKNAKIFPLIGFAGSLPNWGGPFEGERPTAYIVILLDTDIAKNSLGDHTIAAQSILLGATEKGLGGCMHGSAKKPEMMQALSIPTKYEIQLVISLGKPKEKVVLEPLGQERKTTYYRDAEQTHHVPKRSLDEIIIG